MMRNAKRTDLTGLEAMALAQGGYFDRNDAHAHGVMDALLTYHVRVGRFERTFPGVYRLRTAPLSPRDEYLLAWVWTNYRGAISHESALALYELSDIMPSQIHVTVPRGFHRDSAPFRVHLSPLPPDEVQWYDGVLATKPARSIIDSAAIGTDPEQIQKAVGEAIDRGLTTSNQLREMALRRHSNQHHRNIRELIEQALRHAAA